MKNVFGACVEDYVNVQWHLDTIGFVSRSRHRQYAKSCPARLRLLLEDFEFTTMRAVLSQEGRLEPGV